jgi:hypothetical protein
MVALVYQDSCLNLNQLFITEKPRNLSIETHNPYFLIQCCLHLHHQNQATVKRNRKKDQDIPV